MANFSVFQRNVWTVLGLPFDAVTTEQSVDLLLSNIVSSTPCFLTTPNLDFAIESLHDEKFKRSVLNSDLVVADGMPIIWVAKMLGVPLLERVAGSSVFELMRQNNNAVSFSVFFFGGPEGIAKKACDVLSAQSSVMKPAGFYYPGFGTVEDMSRDDIINQINESGADFVLVALGAKKGQLWIEHNQQKLKAPVISHLGAVVNFVAGSVKRAPLWMQSYGLEWVWRLLEERRLFKRYWYDGVSYLKLMYFNVLPYRRYLRASAKLKRVDRIFDFAECSNGHNVCFSLKGDGVVGYRDKLRQLCIEAVGAGKDVVFDCAELTDVDCSALGLFQLLEAQLKKSELKLTFDNVPVVVARIFKWNLTDYLLEN